MPDRSEIEHRLTERSRLSVEALVELALAGIDCGLFEDTERRIEHAIAQGVRDARLYQVLGVVRRERLDAAGALSAFRAAAELAPNDVRIAHGVARSAWEAGLPAVPAYEAARRLAPRDAGLIGGHASALLADGRGLEAEAALRTTLNENPGWLDGHGAYARIVKAACLPVDETRTVRDALARHPDDVVLWRLLLRLLLDARRYEAVTEAATAATARLGNGPEWIRARAIACSEAGDPVAAQILFDQLGLPGKAGGWVHPLRNLIRLGRYDEACALAERPVQLPDEAALWPYRALLWRLMNHPRWAWLEGDERLIGIYDLDLSPGEIEALAQRLRALHRRSGMLPDQSVRGGTQTDGNVLARAEPEFRRLLAALRRAIAAHVVQLPRSTAGHPTLIDTRSTERIAGSWSVRLTGAGMHVDHVHPQGWLSSAFYVAVPDTAATCRPDGWLVFGEARDLLPSFAGFRFVEPKPGRLVLFPSTMWHGTRPFLAGERITVAFDVARP